MAAREMHTYIDGTSALKLEDSQERFTVLPGGRSASVSGSDEYFADDLRIAYAASGLGEARSSLKMGSAAGASRIPASLGAVLMSCACTFVLGMLIVL